MYEYSCKVERVVDGDTSHVALDLGFNILHKWPYSFIWY